jgi:hypothetical protein
MERPIEADDIRTAGDESGQLERPSTPSAPELVRQTLTDPQGSGGSVNVGFRPISGRGGGGFGGGGVVASAFGGVQLADIFDRGDDGCADGGQVGWPVAGTAGGGIFPEGHVADVVMYLDGPVLPDEAGQVLAGGVGAGEAGDGVDGLAGGLAGSSGSLGPADAVPAR